MTSPSAGAGPPLSSNQQLDLRITSEAGVHSLRSYLEHDEAESHRLIVSWPTENLRLFPLRPGQPIVVEVSHPGDALYAVDTLLESAINEEPPRLVLIQTGEWQRLQRREWVRHAVDMRPSQAVQLLPNGQRLTLDAIILDLSAGGMRLKTNVALSVGDLVELAFETPSGGAELRFKINVLRCIEPSRPQAAWESGCHFVEPSVTECEQIVQFILAQQGAVARLG